MTPKNQLKRPTPSLSLIAVVVACFVFAPRIQAVTPSPDGCYPGFTTAEGCNALNFLTTGAGNTAVGWYSLFLDTSGSYNTGVGAGALALNNADSNTAVGTGAMLLNTTGNLNTAVGTNALLNNDRGLRNNAVGAFALFNNVDGNRNRAFDNAALRENIHADSNTAIGAFALMNNDITGNGLGNSNTAVGDDALSNNTDGFGNTAVGTLALPFNNTGNDNTALGIGAGSGVTTASNVIAIGSPGANVSNSCFIGHIRGVTTAIADAIPVLISSAGQLGTISSSRRFKEEIQPTDKASEAILALKPVTFQYKTDTKDTPQFGLIAEEVAEVNPDLVVRDENGDLYTVRYDAVNAMLLNEFLKEHRKVEDQERRIQEQEAVIEQLKKEMETVVAHLKEHDSKIQRVIDQVEINKGSLQVVRSEQ